MTTLKKIPKYLMESIVIIASILGAFALDRYYENYKDEERVSRLFLEVRNDLLYDINALNQRLLFNYNDMRDFEKILNGARDDAFIGHLIKPGYSTLMLTDGNYNELKKFTFDIPLEYGDALAHLNDLHGRFTKRNQNDFEQMVNYRNEYLNIVSKEKWYNQLLTDFTLSDNAYEDVLANVELNNQIRLIHFQINIAYNNHLAMKSVAIEIILNLDSLNDENLPFLEFTHPTAKAVVDELQAQYTGEYTYYDSLHIDKLFFKDGWLIDATVFNESGETSYDVFQQYEEDLFIKIDLIDTIKMIRNGNNQITAYSDNQGENIHYKQ